MVSKIIQRPLTVDLISFDNAYRIGLKSQENFFDFRRPIFRNSF